MQQNVSGAARAGGAGMWCSAYEFGQSRTTQGMSVSVSRKILKISCHEFAQYVLNIGLYWLDWGSKVPGSPLYRALLMQETSKGILPTML